MKEKLNKIKHLLNQSDNVVSISMAGIHCIIYKESDNYFITWEGHISVSKSLEELNENTINSLYKTLFPQS